MPAKLILAFVVLLSHFVYAEDQAIKSWHFAVSGDSRNCGDVIMPAIAASVAQNDAEFYWHLGDFRAFYTVDEDMQSRYKGALNYQNNKDEYLRIAWGDFLANQVAAFGTIPVHLGIGNHEVMTGKTVGDFLTQFGYWVDTPEIRAQRAPADIQRGKLTTYYHWKQHNIGFIYLDNSSNDGFTDPDDANGSQRQIEWFEQVLAQDKNDPAVRTLVVGMHRALSNSLACGHSMNGDVGNENKQSIDGGRRVYEDLAKWKDESKKFVYVLASHSHFYMEGIFETPYWEHRKIDGESVLPGWIVGTAGAMRYNLPNYPKEFLDRHHAQTDVAGYLLATVKENGEIEFEFKKVEAGEIPKSVRNLYPGDFVQGCFIRNHDPKDHPPPPSCNEQ
jgi:hypothetical protein